MKAVNKGEKYLDQLGKECSIVKKKPYKTLYKEIEADPNRDILIHSKLTYRFNTVPISQR